MRICTKVGDDDDENIAAPDVDAAAAADADAGDGNTSSSKMSPKPCSNASSCFTPIAFTQHLHTFSAIDEGYYKTWMGFIVFPPYFYLMMGLTNIPEYAFTFCTGLELLTSAAAAAAAATAASNAHAKDVNATCK